MSLTEHPDGGPTPDCRRQDPTCDPQEGATDGLCRLTGFWVRAPVRSRRGRPMPRPASAPRRPGGHSTHPGAGVTAPKITPRDIPGAANTTAIVLESVGVLGGRLAPHNAGQWTPVILLSPSLPVRSGHRLREIPRRTCSLTWPASSLRGGNAQRPQLSPGPLRCLDGGFRPTGSGACAHAGQGSVCACGWSWG